MVVNKYITYSCYKFYVYTSKDRKSTKVFDSLKWLAAMCSHIANRDEQLVKYLGFAPLSDTSVQLVIITSIPIRKSLMSE